MKYETLRNDIRNGDLLTFSGRSWESSLIRWWTAADVSHCGVAAWLTFSAEVEPRLCVVESTELGGIRVYPLSLALERYAKKHGKTYHQRLDPLCGIDGNRLVGAILTHWGHGYPKRYQFLLVAFGWLRWARQAIRSKGEDLDVDADHCAEAVAWGLSMCQVSLPKPPVLWSPRELSSLPYWGARVEMTP